MVLLIEQQQQKVQERKTLEQLLRELGGMFYIVTRKQEVTVDEALSFVNDARNKSMNDFNIAGLIRSEQGFVSALMNNR